MKAKSQKGNDLSNRGITGIIIPILILIIAVSWYLIYRQSRQIRTLRNSLSSLAIGEKIDYFDLIGTDKKKVDASMLNRVGVSLVFIFKNPCASCNSNLSIWRRMAKVMKNEAKIYGIWFGDHTEMFDLQEKGRLGFKLYTPIDIDKFKKKFNLKNSNAQTLLYYDNKVKAVRDRDLDGEDYTAILKKAKKAGRQLKESRDKTEDNDV